MGESRAVFTRKRPETAKSLAPAGLLADEVIVRPEEFKELLNAKPFVPLRLHMTDGKTFEILHPEFVWVLRGRVDIAIPADPAIGIIDHVEHCSLLHIVRVEPLQPSSKE